MLRSSNTSLKTWRGSLMRITLPSAHRSSSLLWTSVCETHEQRETGWEKRKYHTRVSHEGVQVKKAQKTVVRGVSTQRARDRGRYRPHPCPGQRSMSSGVGPRRNQIRSTGDTLDNGGVQMDCVDATRAMWDVAGYLSDFCGVTAA